MGSRCFPALGLANVAIVALTVLALKNDPKRPHFSLEITFRAAAIFAIFCFFFEVTNQGLNFYFSGSVIAMDAAIAALATVLILQGRSLALGTLLVLSHTLAFGLVNPVQRGLTVVTKSDLFHFVRTHPEVLRGSWLVFSDTIERTGFLSATGCDTYTGMRFLPDIDHLSLFQARGMDAQAFNNSTYLLALPLRPGSKSYFDNPAAHSTRWFVNPADPILKEVGVRWIAFDQKPPPELTAQLTPLSNGPVDKFWLYKVAP
jgi:predicted small integral membrane protein